MSSNGRTAALGAVYLGSNPSEEAMDISGEKIIKSVYKASLVALFSIGVTSPDNVEKFTASFTRALDKEFLKIGLLPHIGGTPRTEPYPTTDTESLNQEDVTKANKSLDDSLDKLQLLNIVKVRLRKQGFETIGQLMTAMQKEPLTSITGIKEKSALQIIEALKLWNQS